MNKASKSLKFTQVNTAFWTALRQELTRLDLSQVRSDSRAMEASDHEAQASTQKASWLLQRSAATLLKFFIIFEQGPRIFFLYWAPQMPQPILSRAALLLLGTPPCLRCRHNKTHRQLKGIIYTPTFTPGPEAEQGKPSSWGPHLRYTSSGEPSFQLLRHFSQILGTRPTCSRSPACLAGGTQLDPLWHPLTSLPEASKVALPAASHPKG